MDRWRGELMDGWVNGWCTDGLAVLSPHTHTLVHTSSPCPGHPPLRNPSSCSSSQTYSTSTPVPAGCWLQTPPLHRCRVFRGGNYCRFQQAHSQLAGGGWLAGGRAVVDGHMGVLSLRSAPLNSGEEASVRLMGMSMMDERLSNCICRRLT